MEIYLPGAGTLDRAISPGVEITRVQGVPPIHSATAATAFQRHPAHLHDSATTAVWMNVSHLSPLLLGFYTPRFSDGCECYSF